MTAAGGFGVFAVVRTATLSLTLLAAVPSCSAGAQYQSVFVDRSGQLHIVLDSGKEILPPRMAGQVSFEKARISPDRRTVAWLVMYPDLLAQFRAADIPGKLVIFRAGRIRHVFTTEQTFWDWQFQNGGKRVAYSTGPTHGGAAECVLRDVDSGRVVDRWRVGARAEPPQWAEALRR